MNKFKAEVKKWKATLSKLFFRLRYWCAAVLFYECDLLILPRHPDRKQQETIRDAIDVEVIKILTLAGFEEVLAKAVEDENEGWLH